MNYNNASENDYGIYLYESNNNIITNILINNYYYGIYIKKSENNTIADSIIFSNHYGIEIISSIDNIITNNNVSENYCGIDLYLSSSNMITYNNISNNIWGIVLDQQSGNIVEHNTVEVIFGKLLRMSVSITNTTVISGNVSAADVAVTIEKGSVKLVAPSPGTADDLYTEANVTKTISIETGKNTTLDLNIEHITLCVTTINADVNKIALNNEPFVFINPDVGTVAIDLDVALNGTFTPEGDFTLTSDVPETVNISKSIGIMVNETQVVVVHATLSNTSAVISVPVHITVNRTWFEETAKGNLSNVKIFKINDTTGELVALKEVVLVNQTDDTITFGAEFSNFSVFALVAQPAVRAAGPAGGGGGSASALPDTLTIPIANPGINIFHVEWLGLDITDVSIDLKRTTLNAKMTLKKIEKPAEISDPEGIIYNNYFEITTNIPRDNIASGTISFRVDKSWVSSNDIDVSTVTLNRYTGKWETLPSTKIREDSTYSYCSAKTSGFSTFVITGKQKEVPAAPAPTPVITSPAPAERQPPTPVAQISTNSWFIGIGAIIVVVIIIGGMYYYLVMLKRKNRKR